jgi:hypothetical protein
VIASERRRAAARRSASDGAPAGKLEHRMQAGGDAEHAHAGRALGERRDERVAPPPVAGPHPAQMAVELAGFDQPGERELVERGARGVGEPLGLDDRLEEPLGQHEPGEPQDGGEGLAGGPGVDDVVRRQRLQSADRSAVVAELAVVVVLDHDTAVGPLASAARRSGASVEPSPTW